MGNSKSVFHMLKIGFFLGSFGIVMGIVGSSGCSTTNAQRTTKQDSDLKDIKDPNRDRNDPVWVYGGLLPKLDDVKVKVSIRGHTVRVTGFLPSSFKGTVPPHAFEEQIGGRRRVMVVYPIATVDSNYIKNNGERASNADPGEYHNVGVYPYNPYGIGGEQNKNTPWGGFPYIEYERGRNIAFHGPITRYGGLWHLIRGPVSHACNRMQGEHVVEFANLLGISMNRNWTKDDLVPVNTVVEVLPHDDYDKITDGALANKFVDVDYRPETNKISAMRIYPRNSHMFKTWSAINHPDWICVAESARLGQANPCGKVAVVSPPPPEPTPEPKPTPIPDKPVVDNVPTHRPNATVCNFDPVSNFVRIWNLSFTQPIGNAMLGGRLEIIGNQFAINPANGAQYRKVWVFGDARERGFSGLGHIAANFVCRN